MEIIPVLDLLGGVVVRGVQGLREEYRPVDSRIVASSDALSVARAFRDQFGLSRLYVADLDAILHARPNQDIYRELAAEGLQLLIDAGLPGVEAAESVLRAGAAQVVAGLETWPGPCELRRLCETVGPQRVVFSLDLKNGRPFGSTSAWASAEPFEIALSAISTGVGEIIVLDLAQVGSNRGLTTGELCVRLRERRAGARIITGGGIRGFSDLERLSKMGVSGALVASALHDGRLGRDEIERLCGPGVQT